MKMLMKPQKAEQYKLDFAHLPAYSADSTHINFANSIQSINVLKKMKIFCPLNVLHTLYTTLLKRNVSCLPVKLEL